MQREEGMEEKVRGGRERGRERGRGAMTHIVKGCISLCDDMVLSIGPCGDPTS